ncbi:waprin-Thr1 isoform X2 [Pogona vitticeps]|uniref:Waprin-Thr1 isoform X2 n=1 Tax=Pogona vitticeps TaxID=103695 RepID=A0A6J0UPP0_9SAUR|nr:WAP four-disulfide core domain protein 3 isoform X2 [Pogona vitticeps]
MSRQHLNLGSTWLDSETRLLPVRHAMRSGLVLLLVGVLAGVLEAKPPSAAARPNMKAVPAEKPGSCPSVMLGGIPQLGICLEMCQSDTQCKGTWKCCRNGCGKNICMEPGP